MQERISEKVVKTGMGIELDAKQIKRLRGVGIRIDVSGLTGSTYVFPNMPYGFECWSNHNRRGFMPLGAYSYAHGFCHDVSRIGRYCSIGAGLSVMVNTHPIDRVSSSPVFYGPRKFLQWGGARENLNHQVPFQAERDPVTIGNDVWIGDDVLIRQGVTVGDGAVLAARSVITKDVPDYAVVGGTPAQILKYRFPEKMIARMKVLAWWQYAVDDLIDLSPDQPDVFVDKVQDAVQSGKISPMPEDRMTLLELKRQLR